MYQAFRRGLSRPLANVEMRGPGANHRSDAPGDMPFGLVMASSVILADVRSRFLGPHGSGTRSPPRGLWSECPSLMDMNSGIAFCRFQCVGLIHVKPKSVKLR